MYPQLCLKSVEAADSENLRKSGPTYVKAGHHTTEAQAFTDPFEKFGLACHLPKEIIVKAGIRTQVFLAPNPVGWLPLSCLAFTSGAREQMHG